jgi:hypothetical protein
MDGTFTDQLVAIRRAAHQLRKHPLALWAIRWYKRKTVESRENLLHGAEGEVASRTEVLNLSQLSGIKGSTPAKSKKTLELASATGLTFGDRASRRVCAAFARTSESSFLNLRIFRLGSCRKNTY